MCINPWWRTELSIEYDITSSAGLDLVLVRSG